MTLPASQALPLIEQYESGGRNVRNYAYDNTHTASGYFQITNTTWQRYAGQVGVDTSQYPTAESAPYQTQQAVAGAIYSNEGFGPWANYDPPLRNAIATGNYSVSDTVASHYADGYNSPGSTSASGYDPEGTGRQNYDPSTGGAANPINSAGSGAMAVAAEIATRSGVVIVGLALLTVGLVWAMREGAA